MTEIAMKAGRREWIGLAVLMLPLLLISMDMTVLFYAVPAVSVALSPSSSELLWILDIYGFVLAGLLMTMGTLGDRIGRRRLLIIGAAAFGVASVASAYAQNAGHLVGARALLGVAGATLMPSTMALIRNMFHDPGQRRTAIAVWMAVFSSGTALGPLISGFLLNHFWWGSVFLINVPVMVLLVICGPLLLPESRDPKPGRFDLLSALLSLLAVLPVIYGIKELAKDGISAAPIATVAIGLAFTTAFILRQRRSANPMIDPKLFRSRAFSGSVLVTTLAIFAMIGYALFTTQFMQLVLGLSPIKAALWSLPTTVAVGASAGIASALAKSIRPAYVMSGGFALGAIGLGVLAQINADAKLWEVMVGATILAVGVVSAMALTGDMIMSAAPPERAGAASALSETANEFGGALGIALLGSLGAAIYRDEVAGALPAGANETLGGATAVAANLPAEIAGPMLETAKAAFTTGLNVTAFAGAIVMIVAGVLAVTLLRNVALATTPEPSTAEERELAPSLP